MDEQQIQLNINDGRTFFSDEISITNNPQRFILDFKNTAPRIDVRSEQGQVPLVLEHNTIMLDAWLAKNLHQLLGDHIKEYEKHYGKITEPKEIKKAKKEAQPIISTQKKPGYFG